MRKNKREIERVSQDVKYVEEEKTKIKEKQKPYI